MIGNIAFLKGGLPPESKDACKIILSNNPQVPVNKGNLWWKTTKKE